MSAPLAMDVQTSPAQVHGCKGTTKNAHTQVKRAIIHKKDRFMMFEGTTKFADVQILSRKSIRSFKSYKVIGLFREIDKSTISGNESTFLGREKTFSGIKTTCESKQS